MNVDIFLFIAKAEGQIEQKHHNRPTRDRFSHLLPVEWVEPIYRETPNQTKFTPFETVQEWFTIRSS
jgi:hypothetical protein